MKLFIRTFSILVALLIVACQYIGESTSDPCNITSTGLDCRFAFDHRLPEHRISLTELQTCLDPTINLTSPRLWGVTNVNVIFRDVPELDLANVRVGDGHYEATSVLLDASCNPTSIAGPFTVIIVGEYQAEFERGRHGEAHEICIARSGFHPLQFDMVTIEEVNARFRTVIEPQLRNDVLLAVDFAVADGLNQTFLGTEAPLPIGANPRCDGWEEWPLEE